MMKLLLLLLVSICCIPSQAADKDYLQNMQKLLDQGQYLELYQNLEDKDPLNADLDIFLVKLHVALNYHVVQNQFEQFGFVNLQPNQKLQDVRKQSGKYKLFTLKAGEILDSLIQVMPEEPSLYKAQTDYFYESFLNYTSDFYLSKDDLIQKLEYSTQKAIELKTADYETFFILGYLKLMNQQYADAQRLFKQSLALNDQYAPVYYNLSYAEFALKNFEQSISYAQKSLDMYIDVFQQSDACRMISYGFDNIGQIDSAVFYIEKAIKLVPQNLDAHVDYLYIAIRENFSDQSKMIMNTILINPTSPEVYNAVINAYYQDGETYQPVLQVLNDMEVIFNHEDLVMSNVYFFRGQLLYDQSPQQAVEYFKKAKTIFEKIHPPTHEVFRVIQDYIDHAKI